MLLFTVVCVVYLNGIKWQFHLRDVKKVKSKETVGNTCIVLKVIFGSQISSQFGMLIK